MNNFTEICTYRRHACSTFRKTSEYWGGLSNMASGFPVRVNGIFIRTSEALYQACRYPHLADVQRTVIAEASPMAAKMKSKVHYRDSRSDWDAVRVAIMRWTLRVKLACNPERFGDLLLLSGTSTIVEDSRRDEFWGARATRENPDVLVGHNVLGRLLVELRETLRELGSEGLAVVPPLDLPDFLLYGQPIAAVGGSVDAPRG